MLTLKSLRSTRAIVPGTSVIPPFACRTNPKFFTGVVLVKPVPTTAPKSFTPLGDMLNVVPLERIVVSGKKLNVHEALSSARKMSSAPALFKPTKGSGVLKGASHQYCVFGLHRYAGIICEGIGSSPVGLLHPDYPARRRLLHDK